MSILSIAVIILGVVVIALNVYVMIRDDKRASAAEAAALQDDKK